MFNNGPLGDKKDMCGGLKVFAIIPHNARESPFFLKVFPQQIVVQPAHTKRISDFTFSSVLSPAHNITQNVVAPILAAVKTKTNAALLVATPTGSESAGLIALDLFSNLLPLMFRAAPTCAVGRLSLVEVRQNGSALVDAIQLRRVQHPGELSSTEVLKATAEHRWGSVMEKLSLRTNSPFAEESMLLVKIVMEGHCEVIVGEVGCGSVYLQLLSLLLRSAHPNKAHRTVPPRIPFISFFSESVPPSALVHVVVVPDPITDETHSVRLLHFASSLCTDSEVDYEAVPDRNEDGVSKRQTSRREVDETDFIIHHTEKEGRPGKQIPSPISKVSPSFMESESSSLAEDRTHKKRDKHRKTEQEYNWRNELLVEDSALNFDTNSSGAALFSMPPESLPSTGSAFSHQPPSFFYREDHQRPHKHIKKVKNSSNPQALHAEVATTGETDRERQLLERLMEAEKVKEEVTTTMAAMESELTRNRQTFDQLVQSLQQTERELLQKTTALAKTLQENKGMSDALHGLMARVASMERSAANEQDIAENHASLLEHAASLEEQLLAAKRHIRTLEQKETERVRNNTLARITPTKSTPTRTALRGKHSATQVKQSKEISPKQKQQHDISFSDGDELAAGSVAVSLAMRQMKKKIAEMAEENKELRKELAEAQQLPRHTGAASNIVLSTPVKDDGRIVAADKECEVLRQQVAFYAEEVRSVQAEKALLQKIVSAHPRGTGASEVAKSVAECMSKAGDTMLHRLATCQSENTTAASQIGEAIEKLKKSINEIVNRSAVGAPPSVACEADGPILNQLLVFEIERLSALKAFIPSFIHLCSATDKVAKRDDQPQREAPASASTRWK